MGGGPIDNQENWDAIRATGIYKFVGTPWSNEEDDGFSGIVSWKPRTTKERISQHSANNARILLLRERLVYITLFIDNWENRENVSSVDIPSLDT